MVITLTHLARVYSFTKARYGELVLGVGGSPICVLLLLVPSAPLHRPPLHSLEATALSATQASSLLLST